MVDTVKEPTKRKCYKYDCKEDALAAKKKRDNRARTERRCRAVEHLTAAQEEKMSPSMKKRGGKSNWKRSVRCRYNRDLRQQKQRKQRR